MDHPTEEKKTNKPSIVLVNILFVLILMEFQHFTSAISETLLPLGVKKNNVTGKHCNVLHVSALSRIHWEAAAEHHAVPVDE